MVRLLLSDTLCGTFALILSRLVFVLFFLISFILGYGLVFVWTASNFDDLIAADRSDIPLVCQFVMVFIDSDPLGRAMVHQRLVLRVINNNSRIQECLLSNSAFFPMVNQADQEVQVDAVVIIVRRFKV